MRVGILTNELFDQRLGRMGGFGWAARESIRCFTEVPELGVDPVVVSSEVDLGAEPVIQVPAVLQRTNRVEFARRLRRERLALLLTIDYRPNYLLPIRTLPRTPMIVWVRDPRGPEEDRRLATLEVPGQPGRAAGVDPIDCRSFAGIARASRLLRRRLLLASPAPETLAPRAAEAFGIAPPALRFLPNPVVERPREPVAPRPGRPRIVFLGRLDPVKRPWLFVELARRFEDVDFLMLGDSHVKGPGSWAPANLPANLRLMGHVGGEQKLRLLESASALINTSIHEALPVSFQESLSVGIPIISCTDTERVPSRFGFYVGSWDGDGAAGLDAFEAAVRKVLDDPESAASLGRAGRAWVERTHTRQRFASAFLKLAAEAGARTSATEAALSATAGRRRR
ncbi:hypothetical protein BH20GEM1_BH20GEM1_12430 [soil metagenome]